MTMHTDRRKRQADGQMCPVVPLHLGVVSTAEAIRRARIRQKLRREDLAAELGISTKQIARIEQGVTRTGEAITRLRERLGVPDSPATPTAEQALQNLPDSALWAEIGRLLAEAQRRYWSRDHDAAPAGLTGVGEPVDDIPPHLRDHHDAAHRVTDDPEQQPGT